MKEHEPGIDAAPLQGLDVRRGKAAHVDRTVNNRRSGHGGGFYCRAESGLDSAAVTVRANPRAEERSVTAAAEGGTGYDELVRRSPQGSIFSTSWWLDAVAPGRWPANVVEDKARVVAAWPTVVTRTRFGDVHAGAPFTPFLGPLLEADESAHRRSREIDHLERLLERLAPYAHLEARCNPAFDYWAPLSWHGFTQTTHYTWRLPELADLEAVWAGLRENVRREVRKARKGGLAVETGALEDLMQLHVRATSGEERERVARANIGALERVDASAATRGARTILVARDAAGRPHSAGLYVHDDRWTYYLVGASDPALRTSGAATLVMWEAIERAAERGTGFDFEGSMLRPVERFVRAFGGVPTAYSIVRKTPSRLYAASVALKRPLARRIGRARA